jgi:enoyl-CoA hydratase
VASIEFLKDLERAVGQLAADKACRLAVFQAEGKVFLAGADIKAMKDYTPQQGREMAEMGHRVFDKIEALPQVTLAAIQGAAVGGGCELVLACDFRFAVKTAPLGQPEVLLGLIPGWGGTARLPRLVGGGPARRLLIGGQSIKADEALQIGLVDRIVNSAEDLGPLIKSFAKDLAKPGAEAVLAVKRVLRGGAAEIDEFARCFERPEAREGMAAFLERRAAKWST